MDSAIQPIPDDSPPTVQNRRVDAKIDILKALTLRIQNNLSFQEIGDLQGVSKQAIQQALSRFEVILETPELITAYEKNRSKLLSGAEMVLLGDIVDKGRREKASLNNVAFTWDKIQLAKRLEDNRSTENVALIQQVIADNKDILDSTSEAMLERMREQSQVDDGPDEALEGEFEEAD